MLKQIKPIVFEIGGVTVSRKIVRKFWLKFHLAIALAVGLVFVLLGLTGSCNVFYYELGEFGLPVPIGTQASQATLDNVMENVIATNPYRDGGWIMILPGYHNDYLWVEYPKPEETKNELFAPLEILVDPYTGKIVSQHFWGQTLLSLIYEIHADFLTGKLGAETGEIGFKIVCFFGVFLFVSCLSGVYLWWPRGGKFKQALTIKRGSSLQRFYFDLHKVAGIYGSVFLLIIAFTGFTFGYNDYVRVLISCFSPVKPNHLKEPKLKSNIIDSKPISIAQALTVADRVFPDSELRGIGTPDGKDGVYMVAKKQVGEANRKRPRSKVWIDQYNGEVLAVQDPNIFTPGETILSLFWPLHDGQALGITGRILWCISGLLPLFLYITGILRWVQKRTAKKLMRSSLNS